MQEGRTHSTKDLKMWVETEKQRFYPGHSNWLQSGQGETVERVMCFIKAEGYWNKIHTVLLTFEFFVKNLRSFHVTIFVNSFSRNSENFKREYIKFKVKH